MASGTSSTSIKMSISTLKIWCDGHDVHLCKTPSPSTSARSLNGVTMVGKKLLLRLQKSNSHGRSHGCMDDNEKKDDLMVVIGWSKFVP